MIPLCNGGERFEQILPALGALTYGARLVSGVPESEGLEVLVGEAAGLVKHTSTEARAEHSNRTEQFVSKKL